MFSIAKILHITQKSISNVTELTPLFRAQISKTGQPLLSFHTCTQNNRWHKDKVDNRRLYRYGYIDRVKQSGALPRISEDSERIRSIKVFRPSNPFAPKEALFGQNDYIDILGNQMFNNYHLFNLCAANFSQADPSYLTSSIILFRR